MSRVEIGITHQIEIDGDPSWVKVCITEDYDSDDIKRNLNEIVDDLSDKVNKQAIRVIEQTHQTVKDYERERRRRLAE